MVEVRGFSGHAAQEGGDSRNKYLRRSSAGKCAQGCVGRLWDQGLQALVVVHHLVVVAKTHGIGEAGLKEMSLLEDSDLPRALATEQNVIDAVRGCESSLVIHVGAGRIVFLGKLVIEPGGEEVFVDDLLTGESVF